jgi:hypothetical protein
MIEEQKVDFANVAVHDRVKFHQNVPMAAQARVFFVQKFLFFLLALATFAQVDYVVAHQNLLCSSRRRWGSGRIRVDPWVCKFTALRLRAPSHVLAHVSDDFPDARIISAFEDFH